MVERNTIDWIALVLLLIGGLNWGLVGLFGLDIIETLLGSIPMLQKLVYVLVGLSAAFMTYKKCC